MKAIAVHPGKPNSIHLREVEEPRVTDVPDGRGVKVKVLRVGVDGTDKEINAAEYGAAPPGDDYLVTGHESFGRSSRSGRTSPPLSAPAATSSRQCAGPARPSTARSACRTSPPTTSTTSAGINLLHGYLTEYYVEDYQYVFPLPANLAEVGVLLEPTTVAEKGVNHAYEIQRRLKVWEPRSACVLGSGTVGLLTALVARLRGLELTVYSLPQKPYRNADLIEQLGGSYVSSQDATLAEASSERGPFDLIVRRDRLQPDRLGGGRGARQERRARARRRSPAATARPRSTPTWINQGFVLGNKVMVGTVNASPNDFRSGVDDLIKAEAIYPGWLGQLLTHPIHGLENYERDDPRR